MALDGASGAGGANGSSGSDRGGSDGVNKGTEDKVSSAMEQAKAATRNDDSDSDGGGSGGSSKSVGGSDGGSSHDAPGAGEGSIDTAAASAQDGGEQAEADRKAADRQADARRDADGKDAEAQSAVEAEARASQDRLEAQGRAAQRSYEAKQAARADHGLDAVAETVAKEKPADDGRTSSDAPETITITGGGAPVTVDGVAYEVGGPRRPDIRHDNGFLQNPNNPTDPVPQPTREPTAEEIAYHDSEVMRVNAAQALSALPGSGFVDERFDLDHALPAYDHFLTGQGADRTFDYDAYLADDPSGQALKADVEADVRRAADETYDGLDERVPDTPGASVTFDMRSAAMGIGGPDPARAYPATEDWQKAIGGHSTWTQSEVAVTRQDDGSLLATARIDLLAEDRYNFNPKQADIATGVPDDLRGILEESGLAQQYTQTGSATFETSWTVGDPGRVVMTARDAFGDR